MKIKNNLKIFIKILIGCIIVFFIYKKIDFSHYFLIFQQVKLSYLFIGYLCGIFTWLLVTKKWEILLIKLITKPTFFQLLHINLATNFYATFLPGGQLIGEFVRFYKIAKNNLEKHKLITSIFMDKILGFFSASILGLIAINLVTPELITNFQMVFNVLIIITIIFFLIILMIIYPVFLPLARKFKKKVVESKISKIFTDIVSQYAGQQKILIHSFFYNLIYQLLGTFSLFIFIKSLNIDISFVNLIWINVFLSLSLFLPITILGIGIREGVLVYLLGLISIAKEEALALATLILALNIFTALLCGLLELNFFIRPGSRSGNHPPGL